MMKKIVTLLAATALMAITAGQALASFNDFDLVRVVYDGSGKEVLDNLGDVRTLTAGATVPAISLSDFGTGKTFANLNVAYFAVDMYGSSSNVWTSGGATAPTSNLNGWQSLANVAANMQGLQAAGSHVIDNVGDTSAYVYNVNQGTNGTGMGASLFSTNVMDASLASLVTAGNTVSQKLYFFSNPDNVQTGVAQFNLITNSDGSTTVTDATPTPIPPSFLLMGSGLLGMVGIRRKFNA
jgi:hypothetical protein